MLKFWEETNTDKDKKYGNAYEKGSLQCKKKRRGEEIWWKILLFILQHKYLHIQSADTQDFC